MSAIGRHRVLSGNRRRLPIRPALVVWGLLLTVLVGLPSGTANASSAASFTSYDIAVDGDGHCLNGDGVNCNAYDGKQYVWLNGGPVGTSLGAGDYFFAVIAPGGQADPNDGSPTLLSTDPVADRTFQVDESGNVTYSGPHDIDGTKIRVAPYADTPNNGGVYILAICSLASGPVAGGACKYDAFKVTTGTTTTPTAAGLEVTKDATGAYTDTYHWTIDKTADQTTIKQVGGSATVNYTVTVGNDGGVISGVTVSGTITVVNPNAPVAVDGVTVADTLSDNTPCTVTGGQNVTVTDFQTEFAYTCSLAALPATPLDNTVTVTWPDQSLANGAQLVGDHADFTFDSIAFTGTAVDDCVNVTDTYAGSLGNVCATGANPTPLTYSRAIPVPTFDCQTVPNTATFVADSTGATHSASQSVTVCGPHKSGALTMGFWQNKNGQSIITGQAKTGTCASATWLRTFAPFQDLGATASCSQVAAYVTNVIKAANASGSSMNAMLKAQMLATALDVYFSDPTLGGNKIAAPAPVGGFVVDLTKICTDIPTCSNFTDTSSAFGTASASVGSLLTVAASHSNAGGSSWYANVKATQALAKDAFDAINNQVAFSP